MVKLIRRYQAFDGTEFDCEQLAYDHEATLLERCKFCDGRAQFYRTEPTESTSSGSASVMCTSCNFSIDCDTDTTDIVLPVGSSCWDYIYAGLDAACERVRRKWNFLMKPSPITKATPEPEPEPTENVYDDFDIVNDWGDRVRVWKTEEER